MPRISWSWTVVAVVVGTGLTAFRAKSAEQEQVKPPKDAVILFDGKNADEWTQGGDKPCPWEVKDGYMQVRGGNILTRKTFTDFKLHIEFWLPRYPDNVKGQARANSGVYLQGRYEVQVLDSYGIEPLTPGDCAGIYGQKPADKNAATQPEEWQTYDITFRAPRFNDAGERIEKPRVTLLWNGVKVHDNVEVNANPGDAKNPGPILLQDHGCPIRYRNVWIVPMNEK